jgi:hypothetical protein
MKSLGYGIRLHADYNELFSVTTQGLIIVLRPIGKSGAAAAV